MREDGGDGEATGTLDVHEEAARRRYERLWFGFLLVSQVCKFPFCSFGEAISTADGAFLCRES